MALRIEALKLQVRVLSGLRFGVEDFRALGPGDYRTLSGLNKTERSELRHSSTILRTILRSPMHVEAMRFPVPEA